MSAPPPGPPPGSEARSEPGPLLMPAADTLLLRLDHPDADACRAELATFAELESSPEHLHTYRLSDLGLWNARSAGIDPDEARP